MATVINPHSIVCALLLIIKIYVKQVHCNLSLSMLFFNKEDRTWTKCKGCCKEQAAC